MAMVRSGVRSTLFCGSSGSDRGLRSGTAEAGHQSHGLVDEQCLLAVKVVRTDVAVDLGCSAATRTAHVGLLGRESSRTRGERRHSTDEVVARSRARRTLEAQQRPAIAGRQGPGRIPPAVSAANRPVTSDSFTAAAPAEARIARGTNHFKTVETPRAASSTTSPSGTCVSTWTSAWTSRLPPAGALRGDRRGARPDSAPAGPRVRPDRYLEPADTANTGEFPALRDHAPAQEQRRTGRGDRKGDPAKTTATVVFVLACV